VKKLAIVLLFVAGGCHRQVNVSSTPTSTATPTPITSGVTGGAASATDALRQFLAAIMAQDVQALANVWGTKQGSIRNTVPMDQVEKRAIYLMRCLRHDSYAVQNETPAAGGDRVMTVQLKRGTLAPSGMFTMSIGPQGRWYVSNLDTPAFNSICTAK
jgi:hypothetical protein